MAVYICTAMIVRGPVEEIQLYVKALKRSGLAPDVTNRAKYTSQAPEVAQVNQRGIITPVSPGVSKITVGLTDPISGKTFRESAVVEVVRLKDVIPTDITNRDDVPKIPRTFPSGYKELKKKQRR